MTRERQPGPWGEVVVVCAGSSWDGPPSSERHVAKALVPYVPVLYVEPAAPRFTTPRRDGDRSVSQPFVRVVSDGLAVLRPRVLPGFTRPLIRSTTPLLVGRAVQRALQHLPGASAGAVMVATPEDLLAVGDARRRAVYATDDWVAGAELMGLSRRSLLHSQRAQARHADVVIAASPLIADAWRRLGQEAVVVPNGCDAGHFVGTDGAPLPRDVTLDAPVAGFVGWLNGRIDLALLEAVAGTGRSLLLVGPRSVGLDDGRFERLVARPNVQWLGPRPFDDLPSYMRVIDVGLTPYADTAFNRASCPLKTLDYLAAGRRVVATDLPAARCLHTELVVRSNDPRGFAAAVDSALARPRSITEAAACRAVASANDWSVRAASMARVLGLGDTGSTGAARS